MTDAPPDTTLGFPRIDSPIVDQLDSDIDGLPSGRLTRPWYQFFRNLYFRVGGATASLIQTITGPNGTLQIQSTISGVGPEVVDVSGGSPVVFTPKFQGLLVAFGCRIDMSRNGSATFPVTLSGGALPMLVGDVATLTWFDAASPPTAFYMPGGA